MNRSPRTHLCVLVFFLAASLFWMRPISYAFSASIPGDKDIWIQVWNQWWVGKSLFELGRSPTFSDHAFHPLGVDLHFHALSPLNSLTGALLAPLVGPIASFNILFLATFWLSGYGAWLLARRLGAGSIGALLAGYVYAFSPRHFLQQSQLEHMSIQWFPFIAFFLIRAREESSARWSAIAGIFFAINFYANAYFGLYGAILVAVFLLGELATPKRDLRGTSVRWSVFCLVGVILVAPYVFGMMGDSHGRFKVPFYVNVHQSLDLLALVTPGAGNPLMRDWFPTMPFYSRFTSWEPDGFLGFTVIALAGYGLMRGTGRRRTLLAAVAAIFIFLALGPALHIGGIVRTASGGMIPMPQAVLQAMPVIGAARVPARHLLVAMLPIAVLAGMGIERLMIERSGKTRAVLAGILIGLVVVEYWHEPLRVSAVGSPPAYCAVIAADSADVAVFDLPLRISRDSSEWWRAIDPDTRGWHQTIHGKRSMTGPISHTALRRQNFLFFLESPLLAPLVSDAVDSSVSRETAAREIERLRIGYVVMHRYLYAGLDSGAFDRDRRIIEETWGFTTVHEDNEVSLLGKAKKNGDS